MLDPFTSLSVASAIVQFVDFGSKLVIEGYGVYKSAEGAPQGDVDTQELVKDLEILCGRLATSSPAHAAQYSPSEKQLQAVALKCQELSKGLFKLLEGLKVTSQGLTRGWDSLRQGVKRTWNADKIEGLQKQLSDVRAQVNTHVLATVRSERRKFGVVLLAGANDHSDSQSSLMSSFRDLTKQNELLHVQRETQLTEIKSCLLTVVQNQERASEGLKEAINQSSAAYAQALASYEGTLNNLFLQLETLSKRGDSIAKSQRILKSLTFIEMSQRHSAIAETYSHTFEWIFEDSTTAFKTWLRTESGIFWVNGKAGSGKSTLMKFLSDHPETQSALSEWALDGKRKMVRASFYFWNPGLPMEKTQEGLLQSLLFQILRKCPYLIPKLFPEKLNDAESSDLSPKPWARAELSSALAKALAFNENDSSAKFCFFIDGLDEYEGDRHQLVEDLKGLSRSSSVKLCVSSRPWTEFKDAFAGDKARTLVLQDLTKGDMDLFVRGMLEQDERFLRMVKEERAAEQLIREIREKAQGVFLWVFLVVRSLLQGLDMHDDIAFLQDRLNDLPDTLDKYFDRMLNSIEPVYQGYASRMLQLMVHGAPVPASAFWYMPKEMKDPDYVLKKLLVPNTDAEAEEQKVKAEHSINAWCRDLLEMRTERKYLAYLTEDAAFLRHRVHFLHRTVRDFLLTKDVQVLLDARIKSEFSPWMSLVRVHLFEAKSLPRCKNAFYAMRRFVEVAREFMVFARRCELHTGTSPVTLIDDLDRVGCHFQEMASAEKRRTVRHWAEYSEPKYDSFITYAMSFDLALYVRLVFARSPRKAGLPEPSRLLSLALLPAQSSLPATAAMPVLAVLQALLDSGADPNHGSRLDQVDRRSLTPWEDYLCRCHQDQHATLWPAARLLLLYGAHANAHVKVDTKRPEIIGNDLSTLCYDNPRPEDYIDADARECLERCCPPEHLDEFDQLLRDDSIQLSPDASKDLDGTMWSRFVNACLGMIYGW